MKPISRLTSFYTPIRDKKDAERVLSDLSVFWYAFGIILIIISLTIAILTSLQVFLSFPVILLFTGFFLSRRKSRLIPLFILFYSLVLIGFTVWYFINTAITDFNSGLLSTLDNPLVGIKTLVFVLPSLLVALLILCSWIAFRSINATFVYHKKMGSQPFWRNISFALVYAFLLPWFAPMTYLFTELPWRYKKFTNIYEYFTGELFIYTVSAIVSIGLFVILTRFFPLVRWTGTQNENVNTRSRLSSLYCRMRSKEDAQTVLYDLSVFWYAFGVFISIVAVINIMEDIDSISAKGIFAFVISIMLGLAAIIIYFSAGYYLPRKNSRVLSIVVLVISIYYALVTIIYFVFIRAPFFSLWLIAILPTLLFISIPLFILLGAWVAIRCVIATFRYHKYNSRKYLEETS